MCVSGVPPAGRFFVSFLFIIILEHLMASEIFPVAASDQYAEKKLSPNSLHLGPSPSIISNCHKASFLPSALSVFNENYTTH